MMDAPTVRDRDIQDSINATHWYLQLIARVQPTHESAWEANAYRPMAPSRGPVCETWWLTAPLLAHEAPLRLARLQRTDPPVHRPLRLPRPGCVVTRLMVSLAAVEALLRRQERQARDAAILATALLAVVVGALLLLRAYDGGAGWLEFGHGLYAVCGVACLLPLRWTPARRRHCRRAGHNPGGVA